MALRVRAMSEDEKKTMRQLAHSRTAQACTGERARIVWLAHHSQRVRAIAQALPLTPTTVRSWLKRFNRLGLAGLEERLRFGGPALYTPEQVSEVIATALTEPSPPRPAVRVLDARSRKRT
jgi:DNA-binding transcriptional ArsR family regulator